MPRFFSCFWQNVIHILKSTSHDTGIPICESSGSNESNGLFPRVSLRSKASLGDAAFLVLRKTGKKSTKQIAAPFKKIVCSAHSNIAYFATLRSESEADDHSDSATGRAFRRVWGTTPLWNASTTWRRRQGLVMVFQWQFFPDMGVLLKMLCKPHLPNGFADHYPYEKWLAIIGNINPTFSGPNPHVFQITGTAWSENVGFFH